MIVNWNGIKFIKRCLDSVLKQEYPNFEVILVDQNSADGSKELLKSKYSSLKLLELDKNYGFTGGYNHGIKHVLEKTDSKICVILNNDTWVETDWLTNLVKGFQSEDIGIVSSYIVLYHKYLPLRITSKEDVEVEDIELGSLSYKNLEYNNKLNYGQIVRYPIKLRANTSKRILVPFEESSNSKSLLIRSANSHKLNVKIGESNFEVMTNSRFKLPEKIYKTWQLEVVQNGGTRLNSKYLYFEEVDFLKPLRPNELKRLKPDITEAGCGCAMGMRTDLLKQFGLLKEEYFAFYEDTEISYRFGVKGYQTMLQTDAIVHHYFWGSTDIISPTKIFYGVRNRLLFIKQYFGGKKFWYFWIRGLARAMLYGLKFDKINFVNYVKALFHAI